MTLGKAARTALVTGASSGIGRELAVALAADGWRVIGTGRDGARIAEAEAAIRAASPTGEGTMLATDLSLLADAAALADRVVGMTDRLDLLANNAGGMTAELAMTPEGYEANYALNHLGPFVLTKRLLPLLRATAKGQPAGRVRILATASDAAEMGPPANLEDLQNLGNWNPGLAYCNGKLANVLHVRGLADRLAADGITAHAMYPGATASRFFESAPAATRERMTGAQLATPAQGADTLVWLALGEEGAQSSGKIWEKRQEMAGPACAQDPAYVAAFWTASEALAARGGF